MPLDDPQNVFQQLLARINELNKLGAEFMAQEDFEAARLHFMAAAQLDSNNPERFEQSRRGAVLASKARSWGNVGAASSDRCAWAFLCLE